MAKKGYEKSYCIECGEKMVRCRIIGFKGWVCNCGYWSTFRTSKYNALKLMKGVNST